MDFLSVKNIRKSFGATTVLNGITFDLEEHQTLSILGRSGCGKTTFLKIIAGLESGDGQIFLTNKDITTQSPQQRGIVYLYQEALLFPHLNVFENVAFGLRLRKVPAAEIQRQVAALLDNLGLSEHLRKMPTELSGGQKQRVAFGRALIVQPRLLLLDEPFGALDVETRGAMQVFFKQMAADQGITAIFVTHDLKEAVLMGDRLGYMEAGNLHIYNDLNEFSQDERTGMQTEIEFWKKL
ncbi:MAG: ABC transporter ATP-binding protein [Saprospiraceae bacterium]